MSETGNGAEYQIVRPDGTVLLSALAHYPSTFLGWEIEPGCDIAGPCAGRYRVLPDDESWTAVIYFPDGYPGPSGDLPEGMREKLSA